MKAKYYLIKNEYLKYENHVYYILKEDGWIVFATSNKASNTIDILDSIDQKQTISKDEVNERLVKLGLKPEPKFSIGQYVRYIGEDLVAYEKGKVYKITEYDKELDLYGVMSELDEDYLLTEEILEELSDEDEREFDEEFYELLS